MIQLYPKYISPIICGGLIQEATPLVEKSLVQYGDVRKESNLRHSYSYKYSEPSACAQAYIQDVLQLAYNITQKTYTPERLDVTMYPPGGYFGKHKDTPYREYTIITALNVGYLGGETNFPEQREEISYQSTGDTLVFRSSLIHEGKPVQRGIKWVAILWLR